MTNWKRKKAKIQEEGGKYSEAWGMRGHKKRN